MNLNKAFIVGRLTRDPEQRTMPNGRQVSNFSIATNRIWTDRESGEKQEQVEFHNIVAFGKLAEICNQYLSKGQLILIEGRIQTRSWDDQGGNKRSRTEIIAETMQMGPRAGGGKAAPEAPEETIEEVQIEEVDEEPKKEKKSKKSRPKSGKDNTGDEPSSAKAMEGEEEIDVKDIPF